MIGIWLRGLLTRRSGRLLGVAIGTALAVALLATLGAFIASSAATMTQRAIAAVPVDWQVLLAPGADAAVTNAIMVATPATAIAPVGYADVASLRANTGGTVQTTGAGVVLGISPQYRQQFPTELRLLIGSLDGVLVAQQTAANLHVSIGDTITIQRNGVPPVDVTVAGVVDLPQADSLFQAVGAPAGIAPQAPPDNVLLLPAAQWHALFDPQAAARPDSVRTQLHVRIGHDLPSDPAAAYIAVQQQARNVEAQLAGSAVIGNNLAARLDGARADARYAEVLFLFLGLPGALLAMALTSSVAASGARRRQHEQALLRVRGATSTQVIQLASVEGVIAGLGGALLGLVIAALAARIIAPDISLFSPAVWLWAAVAATVGLLLAWAAMVLPVWRDRTSTVAAARATIGRGRTPIWQRLYLDVIVLAIAAVMFWRTASTGYQLVLAPEGVPQTAVSYEAFLAPLGLWLGAALLTARLWNMGLAHGRYVLAWLLRPVAKELASVVAHSIGRQRTGQTRGVVLVALALAFATSTAIFNTTYNAQAQVDAELTNGADVQVRGTSTAPPSGQLAQLTELPNVSAAVAMQHRFAYVGADLQDLFGIDPATIGQVTHLANAFFANGDAQATLAALAAQPNGVLVSEETMQDFQLQLGDTVNLRLQRADDKQYHVVPFRFVGVVREFPTAPKDSFLVANAAYIAQQTGTNASEVVLLRTTVDPAVVAQQARQMVSILPGAVVTDIGTAQRAISSSLTAVDLRGLTALELTFAVLLVAGAAGLVLALSLVERQRSFAILAALGAKRAQIGSFVWSEGLLLIVGGLLFGSLIGVTLAEMLVALLTHVFDPPPEALTLPWGYISFLFSAVSLSVVLAVIATVRAAQRGVIAQVRGL